MTRFGWAALLALLPGAAWPQAPIATEPLLPPTRLYPRVAPQPGAAQPVQPAAPARPVPRMVQPGFPAPSGPQVVQPGFPPPAGPQAVQPGFPTPSGPQVVQPPIPAQAVPSVQTPVAPTQPGFPVPPTVPSGPAAPGGQPAAPAGITAQPLPPPAGMTGQPGAPQPNVQTAPPAPNPWLSQGAAVLQVLDKPNAQSATITVKVGQSATYGSLTITVQACMIRPPDMPQDAAAYLAIADSHADQPGFKGWMLRSVPSLDMLQNPIYDVRVLGCAP